MATVELLHRLPPLSWLVEVAQAIDEVWDLGDPFLDVEPDGLVVDGGSPVDPAPSPLAA